MNIDQYSNATATFVVNQGSIQVDGTVFRAIPHGSQTPLSSQYAYQYGGRWNASASYPVLYTSASVAGVRAYVDWQVSYYGVDLADKAPEDQPDLLVLSIQGSFADVATNSGLTFYGLPTTYPIGYLGQEAWTITQPIGAFIYAQGWPGLVTRSATASSWSGLMPEWAEVALFTERAPAPVLVDRLDYRAWYAQ
jgi:hypothetical protein